MEGLRKEDRLFLELGKRRGAIPEAALAKAQARAKAQGISIVEALVSTSGVSIESADELRKELFDLSFTCPECESVDFREIDEPAAKNRRCSECQAKNPAPPPAPPKKKTTGERSFYDAGTQATIGAKKTAATFDAARTQAYTEAGADDPGGKTENVTRGPAPAGSAAASSSSSSSSSEEITEGVSILGGCRIEKRIGQGGMGRVYKGHHDGLDRDMAVKVIDERLVARQGFVDQFFAEARTLAKLDHPNIVRVFNVDTDTSGRHFIVMELLEGGSVEGLWRDRQKRLDLDDAVRITREAADGLLHAHKAGLIHRDVKPGNLMLTQDGRVKVVDFGLAVPTTGEVFIATEIAGTPSYMAPEQVDGLRLDARCDQYALGASLFQLLCGRPPFQGKKTFDILRAHMNDAPPRPSELREGLPEWLDAVVLKMLAKAPADRFPSLAEVVHALDAKDGKPAEPAPARPAINTAEIIRLEKGLKPKPVSPPSWRPAVAAAVACVVVAALFILVPAREAFGGADLSLGDVPGYVRKLEKTLRAKVKPTEPETYQDALAQLDLAIADLGPQPGAATLATLRDALTADKKTLAKGFEDALSKRIAALAADEKLGAVIDLADPSSSSLVALGLDEKAKAWRAPALAALDKRGEVYVPSGVFYTQEAAIGTTLPGFYIDRTEVTNEQWAALLEKAGLDRPPAWPKSGPLPPSLAKKPVVDVTVEQAQKFAKALGKRLPTAAEWEKAARGSDKREWPWGPRFEPGRANVLDGGSGDLEEVDARKSDVSPWGVLGMAGNAMEWVIGSEGPQVAGGGFRSHALSCRVFARFTLEGHSPAVGFRCARDLEKP